MGGDFGTTSGSGVGDFAIDFNSTIKCNPDFGAHPKNPRHRPWAAPDSDWPTLILHDNIL